MTTTLFTQNEISGAVEEYRMLMQECRNLAVKISDLEVDRNEHRLVEETLMPLDAKRRAYRLMGSILVERTVGEVLPSVVSNRENIEKSISAMRQRLEELQKKATEIQVKYQLRVEPSR